MLSKFLKKTVQKPNGCLEWTGCFYKSGYPQFWFEGKKQRGNRVIYKLLHGEIDKTKVVRHSCDNTKCINPDHLQIGTQKENMMDAKSRKRFAAQKKTHCKHGHEFNKENTRIDPLGKRVCRTCARLTMRRLNGYNGFRKKKSHSSQCHGVYYDKQRNRWIVRFAINGKTKQFGSFLTEDEAKIIANANRPTLDEKRPM